MITPRIIKLRNDVLPFITFSGVSTASTLKHWNIVYTSCDIDKLVIYCAHAEKTQFIRLPIVCYGFHFKDVLDIFLQNSTRLKVIFYLEYLIVVQLAREPCFKIKSFNLCVIVLRTCCLSFLSQKFDS